MRPRSTDTCGCMSLLPGRGVRLLPAGARAPPGESGSRLGSCARSREMRGHGVLSRLCRTARCDWCWRTCSSCTPQTVHANSRLYLHVLQVSVSKVHGRREHLQLHGKREHLQLHAAQLVCDCSTGHTLSQTGWEWMRCAPVHTRTAQRWGRHQAFDRERNSFQFFVIYVVRPPFLHGVERHALAKLHVAAAPFVITWLTREWSGITVGRNSM